MVRRAVPPLSVKTDAALPKGDAFSTASASSRSRVRTIEHRPENLLLRDAHVGPHSVDDGRANPEAALAPRHHRVPAVDQYFRSRLFRFGDGALDPGLRLRGNDGTDVAAHYHRPGLRREPVHDVIGRRDGHHHRSRHAPLTRAPTHRRQHSP